MGTYSGSDKRLQYLFGAVSAIVGSIANEYDATQTYVVDAYVIYQNILYKCTTAVSSPEPFDNTKWSAVLIVDEIGSGGGGGGTTVIANPVGQATDTLNKLQVGSTIYSVSGGGGGSDCNYSTTEHVVGTWIDGKPVYGIVIDNLNITAPTYNDWSQVYADNLNIKELIDSRFFDVTNPVNLIQISVDQTQVVNGGFRLLRTTTTAWSNRHITRAILQYTKNSDYPS